MARRPLGLIKQGAQVATPFGKRWQVWQVWQPFLLEVIPANLQLNVLFKLLTGDFNTG